MQITYCLRWQTAMAVLSFTLGILMIIAGVRQLLHPWDLQHHAFFNGAYLPIAIRFLSENVTHLTLWCVHRCVCTACL